MKLTKTFLTFAALLLIAAPAFADFNLVITELDPFGTDFNDPDETDDIEWFEVTNTGDSPWTEADGTLYYDDQDPNFENADPITFESAPGMIAPGESVVFVNLDGVFPDPAADNGFAFFRAEFPDFTGQLGWYDGSGMSSSNEDGAAIWVGGPPTTNDDIVSDLAYPQGSQVMGQTYKADGTWSAPTPGFVVPEPGASLMALVGLLGLLAVRRR